MTPRTVYSALCGVLAFLGVVLLVGLMAWDLYPGNWTDGERMLGFSCAAAAGLLTAVLAHGQPSKFVLDAERKEASK